MSIYAARIRAMAPGCDPRHIEGYMRLQHSTLDHLDPAAFAYEVEIAAACVEAEGAAIAECNASSFGL